MDIDVEMMRAALVAARQKHEQQKIEIVRWMQKSDIAVEELVRAIRQKDIQWFMETGAGHAMAILIDLGGIGLHECLKSHVTRYRITIDGSWLVLGLEGYALTEDVAMATIFDTQDVAGCTVVDLMKRQDGRYLGKVIVIVPVLGEL